MRSDRGLRGQQDEILCGDLWRLGGVIFPGRAFTPPHPAPNAPLSGRNQVGSSPPVCGSCPQRSEGSLGGRRAIEKALLLLQKAIVVYSKVNNGGLYLPCGVTPQSCRLAKVPCNNSILSPATKTIGPFPLDPPAAARSCWSEAVVGRSRRISHFRSKTEGTPCAGECNLRHVDLPEVGVVVARRRPCLVYGSPDCRVVDLVELVLRHVVQDHRVDIDRR